MLPKTPSFWQKRGVASYLLLPLSWIYTLVHLVKTHFSKPYKSPVPVICVGGLVAGGSGKTPVVHALVALAREALHVSNPVILTRGYGGSLAGPSLVDVQAHSFFDVGDEALLHAAHAPTIVAKDRAAGLRLAEAMGADLVIMDDGMQNGSIAKTVTFAIVDTGYNTGNGFTLPAGPLREPMSHAMRRIDAVIATNGVMEMSDKPVFAALLQILSGNDMSKDYTAFAGLGRPEKFRETLTTHGFHVKDFKAFPDHYPYKAEDIEALLALGGTLITTQKDLVRVPGAYWNAIDTLNIGYVFEDSGAVAAFLRARLGR